MLKGYNSDINVKGRMYHVQSEDWGLKNPFLVSRVFHNGAVVKTFKISYEEALRGQPQRTLEILAGALQRQHSDIVDRLMTGAL